MTPMAEKLRKFSPLALLALAIPAHAQTAPPSAPGLQEALQNFPAMIAGPNIHRIAGDETIATPPCPPAGSSVEQKGGPTLEFLGAKPGTPDLCLVRIEGETLEMWYGIWANSWPGGDLAREALRRAINGRTGEVVGFDTVAKPGVTQWHDLIRQEGIEDIWLLGRSWKALKLAHYREGYDGNAYRSVSTLWRDIETGLPIYATYQHISGTPELDGPIIPTKITAGK